VKNAKRAERIKKTAHHHHFDGTVEIKEKHFNQLIDMIEFLEKKDELATSLNEMLMHQRDEFQEKSKEFEKVLIKIARLAGANKEIDYNLWKYAKETLNKR